MKNQVNHDSAKIISMVSMIFFLTAFPALGNEKKTCPDLWRNFAEDANRNLNTMEEMPVVFFADTEGKIYNCTESTAPKSALMHIERMLKLSPNMAENIRPESPKDWPLNVCSSGMMRVYNKIYHIISIPTDPEIYSSMPCQIRLYKSVEFIIEMERQK